MFEKAYCPQCVHTRSLVCVGAASSYHPGSQSDHFSHVPVLFAAVYDPDGHRTHTRSPSALQSATCLNPGRHVLQSAMTASASAVQLATRYCCSCGCEHATQDGDADSEHERLRNETPAVHGGDGRLHGCRMIGPTSTSSTSPLEPTGALMMHVTWMGPVAVTLVLPTTTAP